MIAIGFRFLSGRFHANPWNRHVNEGAVEWPPSPWRILRALVAASHRLRTTPPREELEALLRALSGPPSYHLPRASVGHTRHWMPTDGKRTMVFDTFVAVGSGARDDSAQLVVAWPTAELAEVQVLLLETLLQHIGYLGRADSWIEARRMEWDGAFNTVPIKEGPDPRLASNVSLKAMDVSDAGNERHRSGQIMDTLEQSSSTIQKERWSDLPGTIWINYHRPESLLQIDYHDRPAHPVPLPTVALFALHLSVRTRITEAIAVGEIIRRALIAKANGRADSVMQTFSGHTPDGTPLEGNRHAYYLPLPDRRGFIDRVMVWSPVGFSEEAVDVLQALATWRHHLERHPVHFSLLQLGASDVASRAFDPRPSSLGWEIWESITPFVLPRHPKFRRGLWTDTAVDQLRRLTAQLGHEVISVLPVDSASVGGAQVPWHRFRRQRTRGGRGSKGMERGFGFRIRLASPSKGPIAIGYGAHVGLGLFAPVREAN